jgi:hypothetical protein
MATIGGPDEYEAFLTNGLTGQVIYRWPWSMIRWSRSRNEVSTAAVTIAAEDGGIECCRSFGGLVGWEQLISIERNGSVVWDGPVTGWSRPSGKSGGNGSFTVRAHDRFALTMKRLISLTRAGLSDPGALFYNLLNDAGIGTLSGSPFAYTLPASGDFLLKPANKVDSSVIVERLERVYDAVAALVAQNAISYSQVCDTLWPDETVVRDLLGPYGVRPKLSEDVVIDIPGVEVDALNLATVAYGGALGQGTAGSAVISTQLPFYGVYSSSTLHTGQQFDRPAEVNPLVAADGYVTQLDVATEVLAAESATPAFTIEQVRVSCDFGSTEMNEDLSNLIPGAIIDIDFEDTCAFNEPFVGTRDEYLYWYTSGTDPEPTLDVYSWMARPVSSATIHAARLERIDVTVSMTEDGIEEEFLVSLTPTAETDELGVGGSWLDATADPPSGRYPGA